MSSNVFFDFISKSIINSLSERLSKQLNIKSEYIQKALYDENFTIKNEVRIDILENKVDENENNVEQVKNEVRIDIQENKEEVLNVPLEGVVMGNNVPHLDESIYIYNFYNLEYKDSETFWKHKRIKIENKYYRLHLATNLILDPRKDGTLVLIGMRNIENECMNLEELDPIVFKWCDVHSIHYK